MFAGCPSEFFYASALVVSRYVWLSGRQVEDRSLRRTRQKYPLLENRKPATKEACRAKPVRWQKRQVAQGRVPLSRHLVLRHEFMSSFLLISFQRVLTKVVVPQHHVQDSSYLVQKIARQIKKNWLAAPVHSTSGSRTRTRNANVAPIPIAIPIAIPMLRKSAKNLERGGKRYSARRRFLSRDVGAGLRAKAVPRPAHSAALVTRFSTSPVSNHASKKSA